MIKGENEIRKEIPEFELYKLDTIISLNVELKEPEINGKKNDIDVTISCKYPYKNNTYIIFFRLYGVKQFKLPEIGTNWFGFSELEIVDVKKHMMENINFQVKDFGGTSFSCYCRDIEFIELRKMS